MTAGWRRCPRRRTGTSPRQSARSGSGRRLARSWPHLPAENFLRLGQLLSGADPFGRKLGARARATVPAFAGRAVAGHGASRRQPEDLGYLGDVVTTDFPAAVYL